MVCPHLGISNLLTVCISFIPITSPFHLCRFSVFLSDAYAILVVHLTRSFRVVFLLVTPHIHLSILISFTSSRARCRLFVAHVSASYNRAGLTKVLYTFPFSVMNMGPNPDRLIPYECRPVFNKTRHDKTRQYRHPLVAQHTTASLYPCSTRSLYDCCCPWMTNSVKQIPYSQH